MRIHVRMIRIYCLGTLLLLGGWRCNGPPPEPSGPASGAIDFLDDPVQESIGRDTSITLRIEDGVFTIKLIDRYTLAGVLVSRKDFSRGWEAVVVPVDLAICWGRIAESDNLKYVGFSQRGRWYHFKIGMESPFDKDYVYLHSANNHIIPATENILLAVKAARKKEPIVLEGYLVDINGTYKGKTYWWYSSRVRSDRGQGSCELLYVTRVRFGDHYYE